MANFHSADPRPRMPCRNVNGLVEVLCVNQVVTAEMLARLRKRAVGDKPLAVTHAHTSGRRRWVQWSGGSVLSLGLEFVCKLDRLLHRLLERGFTGFVPGLLVVIAEQHVSHGFPSVGNRTIV